MHINNKLTEKLDLINDDQFKEIARQIHTESNIDIIGGYKKNLLKKAAIKAAKSATKHKRRRGPLLP